MTLINKLLTTAGSFSLLHSMYSTFELKQYSKQTSTSFVIPLDIYMELIVSVVMLIYVIIKSNLFSDEIGVNLYTGEVSPLPSLKLDPIFMRDAVVNDEKFESGNFDNIENDPIFMDITKRRETFSEWSSKKNN